MSICIPSALPTVSYWRAAEVGNFEPAWRTFPQHSRRQRIHVWGQYIELEKFFLIDGERTNKRDSKEKENGGYERGARWSRKELNTKSRGYICFPGNLSCELQTRFEFAATLPGG